MNNNTESPLNLLLLYRHYPSVAETFNNHIDALENYSKHKIVRRSINDNTHNSINLKQFDGVVIHYGIIACIDFSLSPEFRRRIRDYRGLKAVFAQDEYRYVERTIEVFSYLKIDVLFTVVQEEILESYYPPDRLPGVEKVTLLTGYVHEPLIQRQVPEWGDRGIDVGYRARKVPSWLGAFGQEKFRIGQRFAMDAERFGLSCDISFTEESRLYGEDWMDFLGNCRAVLGTESSATVYDFTGEIQANVEYFEARHPNASFEDVKRGVLKGLEDGLTIRVVSPRSFEAAALRTLMIMYPGAYSGRLEPWRHYVPLEKDHSNMAEVVGVLRNPKQAQGIIDRAYEEVARNPKNTFRAMAAEFDEAIDKRVRAREIALAPAVREQANPEQDVEIFALDGPLYRILWSCFVLLRGVYRAVTKPLPGPARLAIQRRVEMVSLILRLAIRLPWPFLRCIIGFGLRNLRYPIFCSLDLAILLNGLEHSRRSTNTLTQLLWYPERGTLTIRNVLPESVGVTDVQQMTRDELEGLFSRGQVRTLVWESWDWGSALPTGLNRFHAFPALIEHGVPAPGYLAKMIWRAAFQWPDGEKETRQKAVSGFGA